MADMTADVLVRPLITPEGVDLKVKLAPVSERAIALIIDIAIIVGVLFVLSLGTLAILAEINVEESREVAAIIWLLGFFLLRNFYFTLFECGARGALCGIECGGGRPA